MKATLPTLAIGAVVIAALAATYLLFFPAEEPAITPVAIDPATQAVQRDEARARLEQLRQKHLQSQMEPAPAPVPAPAPTPAVEPPSAIIPPPLELTGSDQVVIKALQKLSPALAQWLIPSEQIRKWVLAVDLLADGQLPRRYRPVDYPTAAFVVEKQGNTLLLSEQNYSRLTPLIEALTALDTQLLADYYRAWKPLLEEAYQEQGKPGTFEARLLTALSNVIAVNSLPTKAELIRPSVLYRYKSETLEEASDIEKFCWRIGEEHTLSLQTFARSLRNEIDQF